MAKEIILPKLWKVVDGNHYFEVNGLISIDIRDGYVFIISSHGTQCRSIEHKEFLEKVAILKEDNSH